MLNYVYSSALCFSAKSQPLTAFVVQLVLFSAFCGIIGFPSICAIFEIEFTQTKFMVFFVLISTWSVAAVALFAYQSWLVKQTPRMTCTVICGSVAYATLTMFVLVYVGTSDDFRVICKLLWENYTYVTFHAIGNIIRYISPFMIYPVVLFWLKVLLVNTESPDDNNNRTRSSHLMLDNKQDQSKLITWVLKVVIMVFVVFELLSHIGIDTGDVVQITQIFSIGISWSMRDWLSGLWACFMLAFTTDIAPSIDNYSKVLIKPAGYSEFMEIKQLGLLFVTCVRTQKADQSQFDAAYPNYSFVSFVHVPNAQLLSGGYELKRGILSK